MTTRTLFEFSDCVFDGKTGAPRPRQPSDLPVTKFDVPFPQRPETPVLDKILDDQPVDKDLFLAFVGRWFFDAGDLDDWGSTPAIIGIPATGKSTILMALRRVYGEHAAVVSGDVSDRRFGFSWIMDCFSWIAPDVNRDTDLARFQPGRRVVRRCRKKSKVIDWRAPGFIAGNKMPKDRSGLHVFRFDDPVQTMDSGLSKRLEQEMPHVVVRSIQVYREALEKSRFSPPLDRSGCWECEMDWPDGGYCVCEIHG